MYELNNAPPPKPVNVTLFGKMIFEDVTNELSQSEIILDWSGP